MLLRRPLQAAGTRPAGRFGAAETDGGAVEAAAGGLPCGPDERRPAAGGDGKSGPVMRPLSWCGVGYSAATTGASGTFLRTLSMPLRQLALAL